MIICDHTHDQNFLRIAFLIVFDCKAKSFAINFFSSLSRSPQCFWKDCREPFSERFNFSYQGRVGPRCD